MILVRSPKIVRFSHWPNTVSASRSSLPPSNTPRRQRNFSKFKKPWYSAIAGSIDT